MKKYFFILFLSLFSACSFGLGSKTVFTDSHPFVDAAREQIGVVTSYDSGYYEGGYPPFDTGACTDVVDRALSANGYDLKAKIDADMRLNPSLYPSDFDENINFRRVRNLKVYFDRFALSLPTCVDFECIEDSDWQAGDIVTFDQIPGSLWHIAIVSNQMRPYEPDSSVLLPYLIHNHGRGVVEDDLILDWPAPITGHYRILDL